MTLATVAAGVLQIQVPIPFDLNHVNLYVVDTGESLVLVDTGVATDEAFTTIETALGSAGIRFIDIGTIVVTHFHADHAGLAGRFREVMDAPIVMSETDAGAIDRFFGEGQPVEPEEFFISHGAPRSLSAVFPTMLPVLQRLMTRFTADTIVSAGDRVAPGREMVAILTPGHTAGHLAIALPDEHLLIAGDHVLPHITPNIGLYPTSSLNPLRSYIDSLEAVSRLAPRRILPAHGPIIEEPGERIRALVDHHRRRIDHAASVASSGATAWEVAERLFGERLEPFHAWMALFESLAHLEYLVDEGVLCRAQGRSRVLYGPA
jgi:glyoxylase-like metal-dependent hydrolase (beta-lactamase superfamily II)